MKETTDGNCRQVSQAQSFVAKKSVGQHRHSVIRKEIKRGRKRKLERKPPVLKSRTT